MLSDRSDGFAPAIRSVLAAYRSTEAVITQEQITAAWVEYEALRAGHRPCHSCEKYGPPHDGSPCGWCGRQE